MAVSDTLRGFRTQFLYTIHRVVTDCDPAFSYVPEGVEDLDIKRHGQTIETIQIKNYKNNTLNPSDLISPAHSTSFFKRAVDTLSQNKEACICLVSYGDVSATLRDNANIHRYLTKSEDKNVKNNAKLLSERFCLKVVDEDSLFDEIVAKLKCAFPTFNANKELKYLLQWVYEKAERRINNEFSYTDLINELSCYQAFENRQGISSGELGIRIIPLFQESLPFDHNVLRQEFHSGISAKPEHIDIGLDIVRKEKMEAIRKAFKKNNVVVINGASGQGKSVLSYRYIKDNCALAYEIYSCDRNSLANLKATLTDLCTNLSVPVLLYFDAKPADASWIEIISTFSGVQNVQCLVSIRNEDWNQYRSLLGSLVLYKDIECSLSKDEARLIFEELRKDADEEYEVFDSVWERLGEGVALLEFVYFITHGQVLKDKLASQWEALSDVEKSILENIITVNNFGGRMSRNSELLSEQFAYSVSQDAIYKHVGEFFTVDINGILDVVHPIRTRILAETIYGNDASIMCKKALSLYYKVDVEDSHLYLLNLFKQGMTVNELLNATFTNSVIGARQFAGIVRALIWKGTEDYLRETRPLIDKLKEIIGPFWEFLLPVNFTEKDIKSNVDSLLQLCPNIPDASEIVDSFPSQDKVFIHLKRLIVHDFTVILHSNSDWVKLSDALYRVSLSNYSPSIEIEGGIDLDTITVDEISVILLGLKSLGVKVELWKMLEEAFVEKIRKEYLLINFNIGDDCIEAITYIDYVGLSDVTNKQSKDSKSTNALIVGIIDLLRKAFPEKNRYHVKLGEDELSGIVVDSEMNLQKVDLPLKGMQEIRSCIINQYKNQIGISDKKYYAERIICLRKEIAVANNRMSAVFSDCLKKGRFAKNELIEAYNLCAEVTSKEIPEPAYISSNIFGYGVIEDSDKRSSWEQLHSVMFQYQSKLHHFYRQFPKVLLKEEKNEIPSKACIFDALVATKEMQVKFKEQLSAYIPNKKELKSLEVNEYDSVLALWVFWETICQGKSNVSLTSQMERYRQMAGNLSFLIIKNLESAFTCEYIKAKVCKCDRTLNVAVEFSNKEEYIRTNDFLEIVITDVFGKYDTYTSQEYILRSTFESIIVQFVYVDSFGIKHSFSSVARKYDICHLLCQKQKNESVDSLIFVPEYTNDVDALLKDYEETIGLARSIVFVGYQITQMNSNVANFDELGYQIINLYQSRCLSECVSHKDAVNRFSKILSEFQELPCLDELKLLVIVIDEITESQVLHDYLELLSSYLQTILENDMEIRQALIEAQNI